MLSAPWYYCTLLREPVDRLLSNYYYYRALGRQHALDTNYQPHSDPLVQAAVDNELEAYLAIDNTLITRSYTNLQASHFAKRLVAYPDALSKSALLQAAIASLEEFELVGVFEDVRGFVDVVAKDLGREPARVPRLNITFDRLAVNEVPEALAAKLREANDVDTKLYEWARQQFAERKRYFETPEGRERVAANREECRQLEAAGMGSAEERDPSMEFGTREAALVAVNCIGEHSGTDEILSGETLDLIIECKALLTLEDVTIGVAIRDSRGQLVYGINTRLLGLKITMAAKEPFSQRLTLRTPLAPGVYHVTVALHRGVSHMEGCYHWKERAATFKVVGKGGHAFEGLVDLDLTPQASRHVQSTDAAA